MVAERENEMRDEEKGGVPCISSISLFLRGFNMFKGGLTLIVGKCWA